MKAQPAIRPREKEEKERRIDSVTGGKIMSQTKVIKITISKAMIDFLNYLLSHSFQPNLTPIHS
jgi:hypothetical protein